MYWILPDLKKRECPAYPTMLDPHGYLNLAVY